MLETVDSQKIYLTYNLLVTYYHTEFHMPLPNGWLVNAVKLYAKATFLYGHQAVLHFIKK
jgi:hypothetical protein